MPQLLSNYIHYTFGWQIFVTKSNGERMVSQTGMIPTLREFTGEWQNQVPNQSLYKYAIIVIMSARN